VSIYDNVTRRQKGGIVEPEKKNLARQRLDKHVTAAKETQARIEELLETMFSMRSVPKLYKERRLENLVPGRKGGTVVAVREGIPHNHVDLSLLVIIEATGVCIPIGNSEVLLAAVCKSPGHVWNDADITELLSFRCKSLLAGDLKLNIHFGIA
jgi:hypothetical protein